MLVASVRTAAGGCAAGRARRKVGLRCDSTRRLGWTPAACRTRAAVAAVGWAAAACGCRSPGDQGRRRDRRVPGDPADRRDLPVQRASTSPAVAGRSARRARPSTPAGSRATPTATPTARPAPTPTRTSTAPGSPSRTPSSTTGRTTCRRRADARSSPRRWSTFTGAVNTGCGQATSQVGPFYCPADATIYLDTTFFDDVLEQQLGGPDGGFVEPYVLAHEYGHHIQNLLGTMGQVRTQQGPLSDAVRLELQADCYAGMWARAATSTAGRRPAARCSPSCPGGHPAGHRGRRGGGRRPDPAEDPGPGHRGVVDARLGRPAGRLVQDRVQQGSLQACDTFAGEHPVGRG